MTQLTKAERLRRAAEKAAQPKEPPKEVQPKEVVVKPTKVAKPTIVAPPRVTLPPVPIVEWHGAYDETWKGQITPESFAHPAKASRALLGKIFDYLFAVGALSKGSRVIDPFGGIGTTGIIGAWRGCQVTCCELEPKFVGLATANFDMHAVNLDAMGLPQPRIVQGDSRKLRHNISEAVVSSPPYAEGLGHGGTPTVGGGKAGDKVLDAMQDGYGETTGQLTGMTEGAVDAVVSSPPYANPQTHERGGIFNEGTPGQRGCNTSHAPAGFVPSSNPSDIGGMKIDGGVDAVVTSPPYVAPPGHDTGHPRLDATEDARRETNGSARRSGYAHAEGQIADLPAGEVDAVVASPPYAEIATGAGGLNTKPAAEGQQGGRSARAASQDTDQRYGDADGQLSKLPSSDIDVVISSPPYESAISERGGRQVEVEPRRDKNGQPFPQETDLKPYGETEGQLGSMETTGVDSVIGSPPYASDALGHERGKAQIDALPSGAPKWKEAETVPTAYGEETEGQLGSMLSDVGVEAVVTSPPYSASGLGSSPASEGPNGRPTENKGASQPLDQYGTTDGQLNHAPEGNLNDALVSSPPFGSGDSASAQSMTTRDDKSAQWVKANVGSAGTEGYGTSDGQMAQMSMKTEQDTFWTAARDIVRECHAALKPGGYACWIVKAFVRDKQIVDFPGDWRKLCEYVGFETLTEVRAMLVKHGEHHGQESPLVEGMIFDEKKERKSFFRRLAESKGSPKIDYEVVWIMRKRS